MIDIKIAGIISALKIPAIVVGSLLATGVVLTSLGFDISTPGEQHQNIEFRLEKLESKVDALFLGHCIEWELEILQRSGMIALCREMGIEK